VAIVINTPHNYRFYRTWTIIVSNTCNFSCIFKEKNY